MKDAIRQRAAELGFDDCRFTSAAPPAGAERLQSWLDQKKHGEMAWLERNAEKRAEPQKVLPGAKSVICLAASYAQNGLIQRRQQPLTRPADTFFTSDGDGVKDAQVSGRSSASGIIARYARFQDYHEVLAGRLKALARFIDLLADLKVRSLWYVDTGPILERDFAQRAGLGFAGKHTNLISRRLGNWIFLAEILTTLELAPDAPEKNHCGNCARCLAACPTQAITAPFQLDARRCISYLTIELKGSIPAGFRKAVGSRIFGCDDCLAVCPWNRFAREGNLMKAHARQDLAAPELIGLLQLDEAGFKSRFAGTPMLRTKRRGILRNACVALGNVGDASALPALEKAAHDPEPLIVEHARWALAEIATRRK